MTPTLEPRWEAHLREAVRYFWLTRDKQSAAQGAKTGQRDAGWRTAVTGGKQMNGFVELVRDFLSASGIEKPDIYCDRAVELPGWFRAGPNGNYREPSSELTFVGLLKSLEGRIAACRK